MRKFIVIAVVVPLAALITAIYFYNGHITLWGFNFVKDDIKSVLIATDKGSYRVTEPEYVLEITKEASRMQKAYESGSNGQMEQPDNYKKLLIQTMDGSTYGGSFWKDSSGTTLDCNGYYWYAGSELFQWIDKALEDAVKVE